jgi:hypothetical protein
MFRTIFSCVDKSKTNGDPANALMPLINSLYTLSNRDEVIILEKSALAAKVLSLCVRFAFVLPHTADESFRYTPTRLSVVEVLSHFLFLLLLLLLYFINKQLIITHHVSITTTALVPPLSSLVSG